MAVLAAFLAACKDYRHILAPGERGQVQILSATRDQAGNLFNFVCGVFESSKALRGLIDCKTAIAHG
jgi:phage terminase large subunit-like protein